MLPLNRGNRADSGLAHLPDEPSLSLAQNSAIILSPRNGNCATLRLESSGYGSLSAEQVGADWTLRDVSDIEFQHGLKKASTLGETIGNLLNLQELTSTSKRLCTTELHSRCYPSRNSLHLSLFIRATAIESARFCR